MSSKREDFSASYRLSSLSTAVDGLSSVVIACRWRFQPKVGKSLRDMILNVKSARITRLCGFEIGRV